MTRYIGYWVRKQLSASGWILSGQISNKESEQIGIFSTKQAAYQVLERIAGIKSVVGREYYAVDDVFNHARLVSVSLQFAGLHADALPKRTKVEGQLATNADIGEHYLFCVEATQSFFWDALRKLELHLRHEIDSAQDFQNVSLNDLASRGGAPV